MKRSPNAVIYLLFMVLSLLFQELVIHQFLGVAKSLWLYPFSLILPVFCFGILLRLSPSKRKVFGDLYHLLLVVYFVSQFLYYRFFKSFYTFSMLGHAGQLVQFTGDAFTLFLNNLLTVFLLFQPLLLYAFIFRKKLLSLPSSRGMANHMNASSLLLLFCLHLIMGQLPDCVGSPYELYHLHSSMVDSTREFGLIPALGIDIRQKVFGYKAPSSYLDKSIQAELPQEKKSIHIQPKKEALLLTPSEEETLPLPIETVVLPKATSSPQILDLDFSSLSKTRENSTIAELDLYFNQVEPSYTNKYTGLFKDYNLIFITAESFWSPAVDKVRTPTLYKMVHEGVYLKNFYNPLWTASTSDGEYMGLVGLLPKEGVWSVLHASAKTMPQALGWRLKMSGYNTFAYHNHDFSYYDRHESHPHLGYDYKGLGSGVEVKPTWPESDLEMMEVTMDEFISKEPFHVYYLTVSGHSGYSYSSNAMAIKNKAYVEDLDLSEEAASYLAANMELEHALSYMMNKLEEKGLAEKTLIVLNPDHYPYPLSEGAQNELIGEPQWEMDRFRSTAIIYAKGMKPITVEKPVSSLDLLPTAYNLLGLSYDSRLLMGRDIFSDDSLVIFYNRSWITDLGFYDARSGLFTPNTKQEVDEDYVEKINQEVREKFYYSTLLLDEDYYSYLPEKAFLP